MGPDVSISARGESVSFVSDGFARQRPGCRQAGIPKPSPLERVQADVGPSGRRAERFQGVTGGSDEDGSDEEDGGARDHVAERLRHDADEV
mmetsp:Transcript_29273/g.86593  ORF Transcript_29273/g.86593 Transcript_29273/m.86593 type:complete len:91 (+) Transcript_29273:603-875(+)